MDENRIIIVEGKTDKEKILEVLEEPVEIFCTFGTLSNETLETIIAKYHKSDVYIFVDYDDSGEKTRKQLRRELPNAHHLYTEKIFKEVAATPLKYLSEILKTAHFNVKNYS